MKKPRVTAIVLVFVILAGLVACGDCRESTTEADILQINDKGNKKSYPYFVETSSATWYLSADDIEAQGLDTMLSEVSEITVMAEQDFSDAREELVSYIDEDIPPVDIYTDFAGNANAAETNSGIYMEAGNYIKVFGGWEFLRFNLLHEYIHYLTMKHSDCDSGFYGESVAEYYSMIVCENRMSKTAWPLLLTEEQIDYWKKYKGWDEENDTMDLERYEYLNAAYYVLGIGMDEEYLCVGQNTIKRTEKIQKSPSYDQLAYAEAAAMLAYLMECYGEDKVISCWNNTEKWEENYGKSFDALYEEYCGWLLEIDYIKEQIPE